MDRGMEFSRLVAVELVAACKRAGVTQRLLAEAMGITPGQVSYYLRGSKGELTVGKLLRAAEWLGIPPDRIVDDAYRALMDGFGRPDGPRAVAAEGEAVKLDRSPAQTVGRSARPGRRA